MKRVLVALAILLFCALAFAQNRWINRDFKYTHSGMQDIGYPCPSVDPTCYTAGWNFEQAVGNYLDDYAATYTMTNNGAAVRVDDGTWPLGLTGAQGMAWNFDGAADFLDRADDGSFDPADDFSVQVIVTPHTIAAGEDCIVAKWETTGNLRGWKLCRSTAGAVFSTSVDGTAITTVTAANCFAAYRPSFITATYDESTTTGTIYCDNLATATNAAMSASIFDTTADFEIAASDTGATLWDGLIHNVVVYIGEALVHTEAHHDNMRNQWMGTASTFARNVVTTTTSASPPAIPFAPPASGTEPFLIDQPANTAYIGSPVANSGGLYGASDLTSKWWRGSCETCAAGDCTGWTIAENVGGGGATVVCDCDTTTSVHGGTSFKFTADNGGLPKAASARNHCEVNWINQDVTLSVYGITTSGAADCDLVLAEYNTAACGGGLAWNVLATGDPGANWTKWEGTIAAAAWNGATSSWRAYIQCDATGTAYTVNFDVAMALQAPTTFHTDASCTTDADADAVCNDTIHSINSPISANGQMSIVGTWRTPFAGTDVAPGTAHLLADGVVAAANTFGFYIRPATSEPGFVVYDNAGAWRLVSPNVLNWTADNDHEVRVRTGGNDNLGLFWNAAWDNTAAGVGGGVRNAAQATTNIGGTSTTGDNVWTRNLQFFRRMIQ